MHCLLPHKLIRFKTGTAMVISLSRLMINNILKPRYFRYMHDKYIFLLKVLLMHFPLKKQLRSSAFWFVNLFEFRQV